MLLVTFLLASGALWLLHAQTRPHYSLSAARAVAAARANPRVRAFLAHDRPSSERVIPLDSRLQRVTFFAGAQVVLDAAVGPRGEVKAIEEHVAGAPASGAALANAPWLLALLTALFLLATMVAPLQRLRNLDALVLASLTATVLLIDHRLVAASVACASLALLYLLLRCLVIGFGARREPSPSTPLLAYVLGRWGPRAQTRSLRMLVLTAALAFAMITLTSGGYTDVAVASLQGATDILHGVLPYGHVGLALHGDTYPLLNYVLYLPGALLTPVTDAFSEFSGSLWVAAAASLLAGLAIYRTAASPLLAPEPRERPVDRQLRATLSWLCFPPVLLAASGGANDLLVAAALAWMLALRKHARASMLALAGAAWVKLVPLALLAAWLPGTRRLLRSLAPSLALSAAMLALLVGLGGPAGFSAMLTAIAFQFQRGSFFAPWYTFGVLAVQPFAQAAVLTLALAVFARLKAERSLRNDPVGLSALAAALLLALQLAANYWTWSYLPWVFPFLALALFARSQARVDGTGPGAPGELPDELSRTEEVRAPGPRARAGEATLRSPRPARRRSPSGAVAGR